MSMRTLALTFALVLAVPSSAFADSPRIASDGFYVGWRVEPGAALTLAYDLDIYLTRDRVLALGPAVAFSFLGTSGAEFGRRQDYLLTVDVLRLKVALRENGEFRPFLTVGGGFNYVHLPGQEGTPREVVLEDGSTTTAHLRFPEQSSMNGIVSVGMGADVYLQTHFGISAEIVSHIRLGENDRVPRFWAEALFGIRFGL